LAFEAVIRHGSRDPWNTEAAQGKTTAALSASYVGRWKASTAVLAGDLRLAPDGKIIQRAADETTRSSYDSTEQALWTVVAGGGGGANEIAFTTTGLDQIGPYSLPSTSITSSNQPGGFFEIPGCTLLVPQSPQPVWIDILISSIFFGNATGLLLLRLVDDRGAASGGVVGVMNTSFESPNIDKAVGPLRVRLDPNTPSRDYRLEVASLQGGNFYLRQTAMSAMEV
jgi:hypothetical protein